MTTEKLIMMSVKSSILITYIEGYEYVDHSI
jgi:hypothetical protein